LLAQKIHSKETIQPCQIVSIKDRGEDEGKVNLSEKKERFQRLPIAIVILS
jgi:hypothetical protein